MGLLPFGSTSFTNALLSMYCRCGTKVDWLRAFGEIHEPDMVSCSTLLKVFNVVGCEKQIHGWCLRSGFLGVIGVCNALISMY